MPFRTAYIMKRFNQLGELTSADGPEIHHQFAQNRLPHEGGAAAERAQNAGALGADEALRAHPRNPQGQGKVHPARRAALHQRTHPPGHGDEQVPQGFHRQIQNHGRVRRSLRARLGLPRPAYRNQGRQGTRRQEARDAPHRRPRRVPQVRAEISRSAARSNSNASASSAASTSPTPR